MDTDCVILYISNLTSRHLKCQGYQEQLRMTMNHKSFFNLNNLSFANKFLNSNNKVINTCPKFKISSFNQLLDEEYH